jgi:hypothetical protein
MTLHFLVKCVIKGAMNNELKDPFDTFERNKYSYFEDLKFGVGSFLIIGGLLATVGVIGYFAISSLLPLLG